MDHEERKRSRVSVTSFRIVSMAFFTLKINNLSLSIKLFAFQIEYLRIINHKRKAMNQKCHLNTSWFFFFPLQHSPKWVLHWNESSDKQHKRPHLSSLFTAKGWLRVLIYFRTLVYRDNKNIERYVRLTWAFPSLDAWCDPQGASVSWGSLLLSLHPLNNVFPWQGLWTVATLCLG